MGTASARVLSWQNCTVGSVQGSEEKHQGSHRFKNHFKRQYARGLYRLSSSGMAVRRACIAKWYGVGSRERLKEPRHDRQKSGSKIQKPSDNLNLAKSWNSGGLPQLVHRRLQSSGIVCSGDAGALYACGDFGPNGSVDKRLDIPNGCDPRNNDQTIFTGTPGHLQGYLDRISENWKLVQSVLPYGSWWEVGDKAEQDGRSISFMSAMSRLWDMIAPDMWIIVAAFFSLVIAALSEISIPHFVAATIFSAQGGLNEQFYKNARLLAIMSCTYGLFSGLRGGCFGIANQILVRRIREKLFSTLLNQDIAFFDMEAVGALTSRLGSDCQQVSRIIGNDLNVMLRNGLQGVGALIYLMTLSWQLAISTVTICSLMWCFMRFYGRYQRSTAKTAQDSVASANEVAEETLSLARVVRTFGTEKEELARYSKWSKKLVDINLRQNVAYGFWTWSSNTLYNATQVVALMIGGRYVMSGLITAEQLTKFILYSEWVVHSTWWVGDHWASLMQAIGASEKVFQLLDLPPSQQVSSSGIRLAEVQGRIQFSDISFQYPARPQVPVLRNVNLSVFPGERVAVVGLSGSGKSTLVGLLLRLYEPSSGQIMIDGVPLSDLDIKWFRMQLGVVSQDPRLFSMDIASNISYGCGKNVNVLDIERAAKQANAHDFIIALPDGYKTMVDNVRLSGGQKQRIAIARALLRDPAILVLDEATSALDSESEHHVQKALDRAMRGDGKRQRTVLIIAHRLSTIKAANRIVVMHQGQIAEMGSHDELLRLNGTYARLTRRQLSTLP